MAYSTNIKQLLDCEAEAQAIINEAKAYRVNKLKQVKKDAAKELEEYKQSLEEKTKLSAKGSVDEETLNKDSEAEIQKSIDRMQEILKSEKADEVLKHIISGVINPVSEIHVNAQK